MVSSTSRADWTRLARSPGVIFPRAMMPSSVVSVLFMR